MEAMHGKAGKYIAALVLSAGFSVPAFAAKAPDCSASSVQSMLDAGQTPFSIYKICKSVTPLLGRQYQGGLIAYMSTQDGSGFVATSSYPVFTTQGWRVQPEAFWQNMNAGSYQATGATGSAIGTGGTNTQKIVQTLGQPTSQPYWPYSYAAYASTQKISGYNDWVLPSAGEMSLVVKNIITYNGCLDTIRQGIGDGHFWTSTEVSYNYAVMTDCNGNSVNSLKNNSDPIRLIRYFKDVPANPVTITGISPSAQTIGQMITITGTGFSATPADDLVGFAGSVSATATTASATQLTVVVPHGAESGPVVVTSSAGKSKPSSTLLTIIPLAISGFSPGSQYVGQPVTISGTGFSATAGDNVVNFSGGVTAPASSTSNGTLTVTVPAGAASGPISVTSHLETSALSAASLQVLTRTAVINFSGLTVGGSANSYTQNGFVLTGMWNDTPCASLPQHGCIYAGEVTGRGPAAQPPAEAAYLSMSSLHFTLEQQNGAAFSLSSALLASLNSQLGAQSVTFTGHLVSGGTVNFTAQTPANSADFQSITFPATFTGLKSVDWDPGLTVITNVNVSN